MEGTTETLEGTPSLEQCIAKLTQLFRVHGNQTEQPKGRNQATKSELCAAWLEGQFCSFFPNCHFAHGWADVKPRIYESKLFKVRPCLSEHCLYTTRCQFFHDDIVYTLTPDLRVFYSEREKMHRITLSSQNGRLLVISLRVPENPQRCPYYVELVPFLNALYTMLPPTSPAFLNKITKQTTGFTSAPQQSKIKVHPAPTHASQLRYHLPSSVQQQQAAAVAHGQFQAAAAAQHHAQAAAHHAMQQQHPYHIQMPTAYHPQYFAPGTPVFSDGSTPKPIARPIAMPDTGSLTRSLSTNSPTPYVQQSLHNPWSQRMPTHHPQPRMTNSHGFHPTGTPTSTAATAGTPLPTPVTHNNLAHLGGYPLTQIPNEHNIDCSYPSNPLGEVMQQFGALSLANGIMENTLENDHNAYVNENFNQVLPQASKMQAFNSTPSRPQPVSRKGLIEFANKTSSRRALTAQMKQPLVGTDPNAMGTNIQVSLPEADQNGFVDASF